MTGLLPMSSGGGGMQTPVKHSNRDEGAINRRIGIKK